MLRFFNNTQTTFDNKLIHLNIFGLTHLLQKNDISGTVQYFDIPIRSGIAHQF